MPSRPNKDRGISLIIPCFNAEDYVGDALESALSQSLPPDEILVVDDGSTDASAEVIRGFEPKVRYLRQDNRGDPSARNAGLAQASCALIAFLDADDLWPSDSLALRWTLLSGSPDVGLVYGATEQFVSSESSRYGRLAPPPTFSAPVAGATLFRREVFNRVGGFNESLRLGSMMDWFSRARHAGIQAGTIADVVLRRRIHDSNSVHDSARLTADYLRALRMAAARNKAPG